MEDQELWDLMGDLEGVGLGDKLTKAYQITGFYEDGEEHLINDALKSPLVNAFIDTNKWDGVDCFCDSLAEPNSPHIDPLVSSWFGVKHLIIKGDLTKVRATEERLRKEFIIEKEIELKDYKKLLTSGSTGYIGSVGPTGISGYTGYTGGTSSTVYSTSGMGGSWSTSGATVSPSKTTAASTTTATMIQTSLKIKMPINDLKDPGGTEVVESYGHPLWAKIKTKFNRIL
jgi:hypothetical protein